MTIYPPLKIPETLAAGPGPGNTDPRVLERFAKTGVADHMQQDVLRFPPTSESRFLWRGSPPVDSRSSMTGFQ